MDIFGFKKLMVIISILELILSSTIYLFAEYPFIFVLENLLVACCLSGTFTTITPLFNKVFGKELATEIYGLTGFFIGVASFLGPILTKVMIKEDEDYLMVYLIGTGICFMKFMALICFKEDEPYVFKHKNEELNNDDKIIKNEEIINNEENEENRDSTKENHIIN